MSRFAKQDGFNGFRLPVAWRFLANTVCGAELHAENFAKYDALVQARLATGGWCIIDIHNYARWNGGGLLAKGVWRIGNLRVCGVSLRRSIRGRVGW